MTHEGGVLSLSQTSIVPENRLCDAQRLLLANNTPKKLIRAAS
jgi:hypothetical protein